MTRTLRIILLIIGLALICLSLAALVYALSPIDPLSQQATLAPTLLAPPGVAP